MFCAMTEPVPHVLDPDDPRAPADAQWAALSPAELARVVAALPSDVQRRQQEQRERDEALGRLTEHAAELARLRGE